MTLESSLTNAIEWLSPHDEAVPYAGIGRFIVGKPLQPFWDLWNAGEDNKEQIRLLGIEVFKTSDGYFVKKLSRILQEPPARNFDGKYIDRFLRPRQKEHLRSMIEIGRSFMGVLDSSQTGTGKTYTAIAYAMTLRLPVFVLAPLSVTAKWKKLIQQFGVPCRCVGNYEAFKGENPYGKMEIVYKPGKVIYALQQRVKIQNFPEIDKRAAFHDFDKMIAFLFRNTPIRATHLDLLDAHKSVRSIAREIRGYKWNAPPDTLFIFDEVHKCKSEKSQNMRLLTAAKCYPTLTLSATMGENPRDFKALGYIADLHNFYDFDMWTETHGCRRKYTEGYREKFIGWEYVKESGGMETLHRELYPAHACQMKTSEIEGFPETVIEAQVYESKDAPKLQEAYQKCVRELEGMVTQNAILAVTARLKYRQEVERLKVPIFKQLINDANEKGFSVCVFVNFKETLAQLLKLFPDTPTVHGGQTGEKGAQERQKQIERFQSNEAQNIFLMIQAGGASIDLHDLGGKNPRISYISPTDNAFDLKQVFGRVHRQGGKSTSYQYLVYMAETVEEEVAENVNEKMKFFDVLTGEFNPNDLLEKGFRK